MQATFRVIGSEDPSGEIDLRKLNRFVQAFRTATLRSAQAVLGLPAFTRSLEDIERPEYRLASLTGASTGLSLVSVLDRELDELAVVRHLGGVTDLVATGRWPPTMRHGEREAWYAVYASLSDSRTGAAVEVRVDAQPAVVVSPDLASALHDRDAVEELQEITVVGTLHLIDVLGRPHFKIQTAAVDLRFPLEDSSLEQVDRLRWRRVGAHALWEVGSNRARLIGDLEETNQVDGVSLGRVVGAPDWFVDELQRLDELGELSSGWAGTGTRAPERRMLRLATQLVRDTHRAFGDSIDEVGPSFAPSTGGGVEFEWEVGRRFLNAEPKGLGRWEILATDSDQVEYEGEVTYSRLFDWLRWLLRGEERPNP